MSLMLTNKGYLILSSTKEIKVVHLSNHENNTHVDGYDQELIISTLLSTPCHLKSGILESITKYIYFLKRNATGMFKICGSESGSFFRTRWIQSHSIKMYLDLVQSRCNPLHSKLITLLPMSLIFHNLTSPVDSPLWGQIFCFPCQLLWTVKIKVPQKLE